MNKAVTGSSNPHLTSCSVGYNRLLVFKLPCTQKHKTYRSKTGHAATSAPEKHAQTQATRLCPSLSPDLLRV